MYLNNPLFRKSVLISWTGAVIVWFLTLFLRCAPSKAIAMPPVKTLCVRFDDVGFATPRFETMSEKDWFEFRESCDTSYAKTDCQKTKLWGPTFGTYCRECDE